MKKKPLMIVAATLIALLVLPPIAHAEVVHFWWDNVYFVAGTDIDYAHPDNVYYGISPSSDWSRLGNNLYHNQINRDTSNYIRLGICTFIDIVIMILTAKLGGSSTATYVAGLAGIVISTVIDMVIDYYFIDERGCIWWWISWLFVYYLYKNLPYLSTVYRDVALAEILAAFLCFGYFRVGMVTFHDPMGIGSPSYTLSISATSGGTTNPSPGTYTYGSGSSVTVTATAYSGYYFSYWVLDGATVYGNPITVTMNTDHTLKAYFGYSGGGGGGGCPILYVYDGEDYIEEGLLDIHNPEGVDVVYEHTLVATPQRVKGAYLMLLTEHPQTHSYIDQVKLYAILKDQTMIELPLIWAWHSEYGNVLPQLLFSDDWKAETLGADWNNGVSQSINLKFAALPPKVKAIAFIFKIEGNNPYFKTVE